MAKYTIDTNVYIGVARDPTKQKAAEIDRFSAAFASSLYLCSVVGLEFLAGTHPSHFREVHQEFVKPYERRKRIIVPSHQAYLLASRAIARFNRPQMADGGPVRTSFWNDALIAATCRENGVTLITINTEDFRRIRQVFAFEYTAPWPRKPRDEEGG